MTFESNSSKRDVPLATIDLLVDLGKENEAKPNPNLQGPILERNIDLSKVPTRMIDLDWEISIEDHHVRNLGSSIDRDL